jgi:hypothetical protein
MKGTFVYCISGDDQVEKINWSLRFLKKFSRSEIIIIKTRTTRRIDHDQIIDLTVPEEFTLHQASIYMKTTLPTLVSSSDVHCYIDTDQIAVSRDVDSIFAFYKPPVTFALDHINLEKFSPLAVNCGCENKKCNHLIEIIAELFGVQITNEAWMHWNGGIFLFSDCSVDFFQYWNNFTVLAFQDAFWKIRDQGTLAATVWFLGMQDHQTLPKKFNWIVDRFKGIPESMRNSLQTTDLVSDSSYKLEPAKSGAYPVFIHFINNGVNSRGWMNWDNVEKLL